MKLIKFKIVSKDADSQGELTISPDKLMYVIRPRDGKFLIYEVAGHVDGPTFFPLLPYDKFMDALDRAIVCPSPKIYDLDEMTE